MHRGSSQLGYIKNTMQKIFLCNNVALGRDDIINEKLFKPEVFHSLETLEVMLPEDTYFIGFQNKVNLEYQ